MITRNSITALLFILSFPVSADSIYLDCGTPEEKFEVVVDSENDEITHHQSNGYSWKAPGFFRAQTISYEKTTDLPGMVMHSQYELDRSDLSVTVTSSLSTGSSDDSAPDTDHGECTIVERSKNLL